MPQSVRPDLHATLHRAANFVHLGVQLLHHAAAAAGGVGAAGLPRAHLLLHNPAPQQRVTQEVSVRLRIPTAVHRHHPLIRLHLLEGPPQQAKTRSPQVIIIF